MRIGKLHPELGAEIIGLDLSTPIDAETAAAMRRAFDENVVLVIRGQNINEEQQLRAAEVFGKVSIRRRPAGGNTPGGEYDSLSCLSPTSSRTESLSAPSAMARCGFTTIPATIRTAPSYAALLDKADKLGRRNLLLEHVPSLRFDPPRAEGQA